MYLSINLRISEILAICWIKRFSKELHKKIITVTKTAYTSNRSTTELVFTSIENVWYKNKTFVWFDKSDAFVSKGTVTVGVPVTNPSESEKVDDHWKRNAIDSGRQKIIYKL